MKIVYTSIFALLQLATSLRINPFNTKKSSTSFLSHRSKRAFSILEENTRKSDYYRECIDEQDCTYEEFHEHWENYGESFEEVEAPYSDIYVMYRKYQDCSQRFKDGKVENDYEAMMRLVASQGVPDPDISVMGSSENEQETRYAVVDNTDFQDLAVASNDSADERYKIQQFENSAWKLFMMKCSPTPATHRQYLRYLQIQTKCTCQNGTPVEENDENCLIDPLSDLWKLPTHERSSYFPTKCQSCNKGYNLDSENEICLDVGGSGSESSEPEPVVPGQGEMVEDDRCWECENDEQCYFGEVKDGVNGFIQCSHDVGYFHACGEGEIFDDDLDVCVFEE